MLWFRDVSIHRDANDRTETCTRTRTRTRTEMHESGQSLTLETSGDDMPSLLLQVPHLARALALTHPTPLPPCHIPARDALCTNSCAPRHHTIVCTNKCYIYPLHVQVSVTYIRYMCNWPACNRACSRRRWPHKMTQETSSSLRCNSCRACTQGRTQGRTHARTHTHAHIHARTHTH